MNNILKNDKINLVIYVVVALCLTVLLGSYVIAANNNITVYGPASIEEGQTLTFNISFPENVENIWLSDGDIIKVGFSGNIKVNKVSDKNYTVVISNIYGVGAGKYITVNSGVGYIDGVPTDAVSSNVFEVTAKPVVEDKEDEKVEDTKPNDSTNSGNNTGNTNNNTNNNNTNNNQNNNKPNTNVNNNTNSNTNTNTNNNVNQNTNNNVNNNQTTTNNNEVNNSQNNTEVVENETTEEVEEIRREIPNTGKII